MDRQMQSSVLAVCLLLALLVTGCAPGRLADLKDCGRISVGVGAGLTAAVKIGDLVQPSLGFFSRTHRFGHETRDYTGHWVEDEAVFPGLTLMVWGSQGHWVGNWLLSCYRAAEEGHMDFADLACGSWFPFHRLWRSNTNDSDSFPTAFNTATDLQAGVTLGFVSVRAGFNPLEFLDFLLGFAGVDLAKDDAPALRPLGFDLSAFAGVDLAKDDAPVKEAAGDSGNGVMMKMVLIPAGEFTMGSPENEKEREADEGPQHRVRITKPFYMGIYEVTQAQYGAVMGVNPAKFKGPNNPVDQVSWNDAQEFCRKLSAKTGQTVRLPTEAEWEYACRAGTTTRFCSGDTESDLDAVGWNWRNSDGKTHAVGGKKPNAWGLYDMHGNVAEWCQDWDKYTYYGESVADDPTGPVMGEYRSLRGGSISDARYRSAFRGAYPPALLHPSPSCGFRVVLVPVR